MQVLPAFFYGFFEDLFHRMTGGVSAVTFSPDAGKNERAVSRAAGINDGHPAAGNGKSDVKASAKRVLNG